MNSHKSHEDQVSRNINGIGQDTAFKKLSRDWLEKSARHGYSYNFKWLGRPIIQYPQDIVAMQELLWSIKPDLIIEAGIAHGGSLIFNASMLGLLDFVDMKSGKTKIERKVLGIDIDIRPHNLEAINNHPLSDYIKMIQGSSISQVVIGEVHEFAKKFNNVLVILDSNHTHEHVLRELEAYANLVTVGSYCVVFDTVVEDMPKDLFLHRPWGPGDNPKTAVRQFLQTHDNFQVDRELENKLQITVAPEGYLKRMF